MEDPPTVMTLEVFDYDGPFSEAELLGRAEVGPGFVSLFLIAKSSSFSSSRMFWSYVLVLCFYSISVLLQGALKTTTHLADAFLAFGMCIIFFVPSPGYSFPCCGQPLELVYLDLMAINCLLRRLTGMFCPSLTFAC